MSAIEFLILGPVEVHCAGRPVPLNAMRHKTLLSRLLLDANRVVPVTSLIEALWGDDPPPSARGRIQVCVSALRHLLGDPSLIVTGSDGYSIRVRAGGLDLALFDQHVADARKAAAAGDLAAAEAEFAAALQLWRGAALAGIRSHFAEVAATRLAERRLIAIEERIKIGLELGKHRELVDELVGLINEYPLREQLRGLLMVALYRSGMQAEALIAYRNAREVLIAELGLEPGEQLRSLENAILRQDPSLDRDQAPRTQVPVAQAYQLPADIADFVGRDARVSQLREYLDAPAMLANQAGPVRIALITGLGGMGKTTLAVHVAQWLRAAYPHGQLFADLRGSERRTADPAEILGRFLRALGCDWPLPPTTDERAELYRSLLDRRRVLVVLDDARDEGQVMPLMPGSPGCAVIVTSQSRLPGLPGARVMELGSLPTRKAVALLTSIVGEGRTGADPGGTARLAALCGGMPLALRVAGAKLAARPHWTVARLVDRLADERLRVDELAYGDVSVRTSLSVTYQALSPQAQRVFRWLGVLDSARFAAWTVGVVVGHDPETTALIIDELVEASLLTVDTGLDGASVSYGFHELVRVFARDRLTAEEPAELRDTVLSQVLGAYLTLAEEAHRRIYGGDYAVLHGNAGRHYPPDTDGLLEDPLAWFDRERTALLAAVSQAADAGLAELCWDLAVTLVTFFEARGHFDDWRRTHEEALAVARKAGNLRGEAALLCSLGSLAAAQRISDDARLVSAALEMFTSLGDTLGMSLAQRNLAFFHHREGRLDEAVVLYEQALAGFRGVGDEAAEAHVLSRLAQVCLDRGDCDRADSMAKRSLAIAQRLPLRRLRIQSLLRIGEVLMSQSRLEEAESAMKEALALAELARDCSGQVYACIGLGQIHALLLRLDEAERNLSHAVTCGRDWGDLLARGRALYALGRFHLEHGSPEGAEDHLIKAASTFNRQSAEVWRARAMDALSTVPSPRS